MKEITGKMFNPYSYITDGELTNKLPDAICITTNGFVKRDGNCVMGKGCAKEAAKKWPGFPKAVGSHIKTMGNTVMLWPHRPCMDHSRARTHIVTFPVKPIAATCLPDKSNVVKHMQSKFKPGRSVPGWACTADYEIIAKSAIQLEKITTEMGWEMVVLPRPGSGAGELYWKDVKPILSTILDDRFYSITFK